MEQRDSRVNPTQLNPLSIIVDLRINETRQTGAVRKPHLPFYRLVGTVSNCAYAVRLETAPTGGRKCLFIFRIHHKSSIHQMELDKRYFGSLIS